MQNPQSTQRKSHRYSPLAASTCPNNCVINSIKFRCMVMNFSNSNTLVRIVTSSSLKHSRIKLCIPIDNATPSVEIGAETRIRPTPNTLDFDQYRERIPVMSRHTIPPLGVCERVGKNTPKHKHTDTRHQREVWGQVRATGASRCLFRSLAKSPSVRLSAIPLALLRC